MDDFSGDWFSLGLFIGTLLGAAAFRLGYWYQSKVDRRKDDN